MQQAENRELIFTDTYTIVEHRTTNDQRENLGRSQRGGEGGRLHDPELSGPEQERTSSFRTPLSPLQRHSSDASLQHTITFAIFSCNHPQVLPTHTSVHAPHFVEPKKPLRLAPRPNQRPPAVSRRFKLMHAAGAAACLYFQTAPPGGCGSGAI